MDCPGPKVESYIKGSIISCFDGALMEHFLKGITLLGHWYINQDEKNNK